MLLGTVLLWALNSTVTRYVVTHGFQPLAYATTRYAAATAALLGRSPTARERSFRIARRDLRLVVARRRDDLLNQLCFVYAVDKTTAATVTLFLGATPIFIGVFATRDRARAACGRSFWIATVVSIIGVALRRLGLGRLLGQRRRRRARRLHRGDLGGRTRSRSRR